MELHGVMQRSAAHGHDHATKQARFLRGCGDFGQSTCWSSDGHAIPHQEGPKPTEIAFAL
jgi:hypothetical protein